MNFHNARARIAAATLLVATAAAAVTALPSAALIPAFASVTPTTVHAGESISASGICGGTTVTIGLNPGWVDSTPPAPGSPIVSSSGVFGAATDWTGALVVPADAAPGSYSFTGHCSGNQNNFDYASVEITVLAAVATTTTSQAPSTSATTTTVATPPAAGPATAVPASPTYTG